MVQMVAAARSHAGLVRASNEDSGYAGPSLLLVADGVGGALAGEVASATAALVAARLTARWRGTEPTAVLGAVVRDARAALAEHLAAHPDHAGLGTTLTALHTDGERCAMVHLGDSRAYVLRRGWLTRLTHDHTLVRELVDAGTLTPAQAAGSPYRHRIVRWLGAEEIAPDLGTVELRPGDRVLLCSDGLTDGVADAEVARLLAAGSPDAAAEALVGAALDAGGRDNVTCVVADLVAGTTPAVGGQVVGAAREVAAVR
jgi:serine/threonine protein phosphatase PrpC